MASKITSVAIALLSTMTFAAENVEPIGFTVPVVKKIAEREMTHKDMLTMR